MSEHGDDDVPKAVRRPWYRDVSRLNLALATTTAGLALFGLLSEPADSLTSEGVLFTRLVFALLAVAPYAVLRIDAAEKRLHELHAPAYRGEGGEGS